MELRQCIICKEEFEARYKSDPTKTCSKECSSRYRSERIKIGKPSKKLTKSCEVCGELFETWPSQDYRTCSRECGSVIQRKSLTGKAKSKEHRKNLSESMKNSEANKKTRFKKGKDNPAYGRNQTGPANNNWKGGKTNSNQKKRNDPRYHDWRKQVFERDEFKCQKCGTRGWLQAHHIVPISVDESKIWDVENGLTVCVPCHEKIHGRFIGKFKQSS